MLEAFRRPPKQKGIGDVGFRQARVQFQCATAMKFRLLQPFTGRVELEMTSRTCKRKRCMSKRETGISRDSIAQAVDRFFQSRRIAGGAKLVSAHEFRI